MNIRVEDKKCFDSMLRNGELKKSWSQIESYGIDSIILAVFEEQLDYEGIGVSTIYNKGVLEAYLYDGIVYNGIYVDRAYIHVNNDVVLMSDYETKVLIIKNKDTKVSDFSTHN